MAGRSDAPKTGASSLSETAPSASPRSRQGGPANPRYQGITGLPLINGNVLKIIAILTMLIDHTAVVVVGTLLFGHSYNAGFDQILMSVESSDLLITYALMRMIGRLSFPIYAFLLVEGFVHTHSVKDYAMRLLLFGCISEIPFDLAVFGTPFYWDYQNVYFTLALGLAAMCCIRRFHENQVRTIVSVGVCCAAAWLLGADYGAFGVFFIALLYFTRRSVRWQTILGAAALLWETTAPLAFLPIRMYDGTRGTQAPKYLFYAFYPLHLLVLWAISCVL